MAAAERQPSVGGRWGRWAIGAMALVLVGLGIGAWQTRQRSVELAAELDQRLEREQSLEQRIAEARAEEDRRLDAIEAARLAREQALREAEQDRSDAEVALGDKEIADQERDQAAAAAERARRIAAEADRRAAEERKTRETEWARFAAALGKVAPARRSGWTLTADLPPDLGLERRSRLAGVLLANQGYRAIMEDGGDPARAEALKQYLIDAGIPPEVLHRTAGERARLRIVDTILNTPPPAPPEPPLPSTSKVAKPNTAASQSGTSAPQFQIQVASLREPADAERLARKLRAKKYRVELDSATRKGWTRVLVGPLESRAEAARVEGRLRSGGYDTWVQRR